MRRDYLYLQDILDACAMIRVFVEGIDASAFLTSELHKAAVLQKLTVIGEAAARLSPAFREAHAQVEWQDIIAFRNIAVHEYFAVQWEIVWATATDDVPVLQRQVQEILQTERLEPADH
ncbi:MAG: HepT-like ribonuclease domain-containing protein [Thermodesulfobacteriota bacterium]